MDGKLARLAASFSVLLASMGSALSAAGAPSEPNSVHRRMEFMCEWVDGRYESSWRLRPCGPEEIAQASDADLDTAMEAFIRDYAGVADIHIRRAEFELAYLHKYPAASRKTLDAEMGALSVELLCGSVALKTQIAEAAGDELARRKEITDKDLRFVRNHKIGIGMSQTALTCLMGKPERRNRTVTARGEDIQWVYGKTLVYTVNGIVTAFQD